MGIQSSINANITNTVPSWQTRFNWTYGFHKEQIVTVFLQSITQTMILVQRRHCTFHFDQHYQMSVSYIKGKKA